APEQLCWAIVITDTSCTLSREFVENVQNRNVYTLLEVINRVTPPGSIIYTDEWRSYELLNPNDLYIHKTVTTNAILLIRLSECILKIQSLIIINLNI
ncbi:hypothetical protein H312_02600, partial [Anncaliia algerae PRA339]